LIVPPKKLVTLDHNHTEAARDGGVLTNDVHDGYVEMSEIATPSTPAANRLRLYCVDDQALHFLEFIDEDGRVGRIQRDVAVFMVRNDTGGTLVRGTCVYINGAHAASNTPTVAKAKSDSESTMPCAGIVTADIANAAFGKILGFGRITGTGAQPIDTSAFAAGDTLWVSPTTAGAFTNTEPVAPNIKQRIGTVTKAHATTGSFVKLEGMFERKYISQFLLTTRGDMIYASAASVPARMAIGAAGKFVRSDGTDPSWQPVADSDVSFTDITTGDVSITKHGYAPKAPNDSTKFLRGDATWATAGGSESAANKTLRALRFT
jgi:hypothetical protein